MLFGNPELAKVLSIAIEIGARLQVYVVPLGYLLILYAAWRTKRLNYDLLVAILALALLFMVLTTTGSPAWFIWALPFLVIYQSNGNRITAFVVTVFALLFTVVSQGAPSASTAVTTHAIHDLIFNAGLVEYLNASVIHSTVRTALVAIGIILGFRVWRDAIEKIFLPDKPFSISYRHSRGFRKRKRHLCRQHSRPFRHPFSGMRTWRRLPSLGPWSACVAGNHAPQPHGE